MRCENRMAAGSTSVARGTRGKGHGRKGGTLQCTPSSSSPSRAARGGGCALLGCSPLACSPGGAEEKLGQGAEAAAEERALAGRVPCPARSPGVPRAPILVTVLEAGREVWQGVRAC